MRPRPPARSVSNGSTSSSNESSKPKLMSSAGGIIGGLTKGASSDGSAKGKTGLSGTNAGGEAGGSKPSTSSSGYSGSGGAGASSKPAPVSSSASGGGSTKQSTGMNSGGTKSGVGGGGGSMTSAGSKLNSSSQSNKLSGSGGGNQQHSSGQGTNSSNSNNNNLSNQSKKKKKPQTVERKDHSLLHRVPIDTALSGVHDIVNAVTSGTDELCDIIINECYVVYECKVCRNFFRNIATFFQHKKSYCTSRFAQVRNDFLDKEIQEKSLFFNNGTKGHVLLSRKTCRRDIMEVLDKLTERRVESEPSFVAFREMCDTASALLTAVIPQRKSDERSATITLPPTSPVRNPSVGHLNNLETYNGVRHSSPLSNSGHHEQQTKVPCPKCDKDFTSKCSLESHVNSVHPDVRLGYLCPCCDQVFVNSWCVNRHLTTAHKKNREEVRKLRLKIEKKLVPTETLFPERGSRRRATSFSSSSNDDDSDEDDKKEPEVTFPCAYCSRTFLRKAAMISHRNYCRLRDPEQRVPPILLSNHEVSSSNTTGKRPRSPSVDSCQSEKKGKTTSVGDGDMKIPDISEARVLLTRTPLPNSVESVTVKEEKEFETAEIEEILGIKSDSVVNTSIKEECDKDDDLYVMETEPPKAKAPVKKRSILDPPEEPQEILSCPGCHRIFLRKAAMASHAILCRVKPNSDQPPPPKKPRGRRPSGIQQTPQKTVDEKAPESQVAVHSEQTKSSSVAFRSAQSDSIQVFDIEDFLGVKLSSQVNFLNAEDSGLDISCHFAGKEIKKEEEPMDEDVGRDGSSDSTTSERSLASSDSDVEEGVPEGNGENEYSESEYEGESDRDGEGVEDFENNMNATNGPMNDQAETDEDEEGEMGTSNAEEEEEDSAITVFGSSEVEESRAGGAAASGTDFEDDSNVSNAEIPLDQNKTDPANVSVKIEEDGEYNDGDCPSKDSDDYGTENGSAKDDWVREKLNTFVDPKCIECLICFQRFKKIDEARTHVALHFNLKAYKCLVNSCGFRTFPCETMTHHVIAEHKKTRKNCWNFIEKLKVKPEDFPENVVVMDVSEGARNAIVAPSTVFNGLSES